MRDLDSNPTYTKINWYLSIMINNNYHGPDTINLYPIVSNNKNTTFVIYIVFDCYFDDKKGFYSMPRGTYLLMWLTTKQYSVLSWWDSKKSWHNSLLHFEES